MTKYINLFFQIAQTGLTRQQTWQNSHMTVHMIGPSPDRHCFCQHMTNTHTNAIFIIPIFYMLKIFSLVKYDIWNCMARTWPLLHWTFVWPTTWQQLFPKTHKNSLQYKLTKVHKAFTVTWPDTWQQLPNALINMANYMTASFIKTHTIIYWKNCRLLSKKDHEA